MCKGCGRLDNKPLGLNRHGEPYLACCPDNNYRVVTAVEYLEEIYQRDGYITAEEFEQAKEIQEKQIIDMAYTFYATIDIDNNECIITKLPEEIYREKYLSNP